MCGGDRGGGGIVSLSVFVLGVAGIAGVAIAGRTPRRGLFTGLITAPVLIVLTFAALAVLPLNLPVIIVLLVLWGAGFSAAVLYDQQATLIAGHRAPETVTGISVLIVQFGIALGAGAGGITVTTFVIEWLPVAGLVFVAASAALLLGLRPILALAAPAGIVRH